MHDEMTREIDIRMLPSWLDDHDVVANVPRPQLGSAERLDDEWDVPTTVPRRPYLGRRSGT